VRTGSSFWKGFYRQGFYLRRDESTFVRATNPYAVDFDILLLSGDMQAGQEKLLLSGDMQSGADGLAITVTNEPRILLSGDMQGAFGTDRMVLSGDMQAGGDGQLVGTEL
jgi:hypothetical protein